MKDLNILFDNNDRVLINAGSQGYSTEDFTQKRMINYLRFQMQIAASEEIREMLKGTLDKVMSLSDEEWAYLILVLPLDVYADADEDESERVYLDN